MSFFDYVFEAAIAEHDVGSKRYMYKVVWLPDEIADQLPLDSFPRLRVTAEVGDVPLNASLTPVRGRWYILLSKKVLTQMGADVGHVVDVRFSIADQTGVDVPDLLRAALEGDARVAKLWDALSPGKKRGLAYRVSSAKTETTQRKRVAEVFEILKGVRDARGRLL